MSGLPSNFAYSSTIERLKREKDIVINEAEFEQSMQEWELKKANEEELLANLAQDENLIKRRILKALKEEFFGEKVSKQFGENASKNIEITK